MTSAMRDDQPAREPTAEIMSPDEAVETLAAIDVDGALRETAAGAVRASRRELLRVLPLAGAIGAGLLAAGGASAASGLTRNDVAILRFDLALEYLQAGLYTEVERLGAVKPRTLAFSRVVGAHERAHAQAIKGFLGSKALPSPSFDYRGVTEDDAAFVKTAVAFEDLTAALLKWQAPRLDSRSIVAAILTLHSVETRHAAWIRHIVGVLPAASAFDQPAPQHQMAELIASTKFVVSRRTTSRRRKPRFTG
ncbi:MAG: ferritin-like domain-containing protein [Solirubrobacteraceae bacterium]